MHDVFRVLSVVCCGFKVSASLGHGDLFFAYALKYNSA